MLGIKENFLNQIRGIYEKPLDRIILDSEILSPKFGINRKMASLTTFFQICSVGL